MKRYHTYIFTIPNSTNSFLIASTVWRKSTTVSREAGILNNNEPICSPVSAFLYGYNKGTLTTCFIVSRINRATQDRQDILAQIPYTGRYKHTQTSVSMTRTLCALLSGDGKRPRQNESKKWGVSRDLRTECCWVLQYVVYIFMYVINIYIYKI